MSGIGESRGHDTCACRKSNPDIFVMQSAEDWAAKNTPCPLNSARYRRILIQGQVRARLIIVIHIRQQHMAKMPLAEHNNVVKAFPWDRTDQPFSISILPWGTRRCWSVANAHRSESADKDLTIGPVPVTNEIAGSLFPTACFRDLICDPFCSGVSCDAKPQNLSAAVPHDQQSIEQAKRDRRHDEQIHLPRCRRHGYEETASSLATVALVSSPYTWLRSFGR